MIIANTFEYLQTLQDQSFDLVLTDPPYDLDEEEKRFLHSQFLRVGRAVIVFAPPENQWTRPADQYLFWIKPISTKNTSQRYSRFVEMIFLYGDLKWNTGRHWSQYTNVFLDLVDDSRKHSFRKPPSLIERLIRNHTNKGDTILDPFAGSCVVEDVGIRLGRDVTSVDWEMNQNEQKSE